MSKAKLTPWFPADVKPVHVGFYHTDEDGHKGRESLWNWWWNGKLWMDEPEGFICKSQNRS